MQSFVNEGKTVLMTSHYMSELELTVDHLVGISNGKIVIDAPTKDILNSLDLLRKHILRRSKGKKVNNMLKRSFLVTFINIVVYLLLKLLFFLFWESAYFLQFKISR